MPRSAADEGDITPYSAAISRPFSPTFVTRHHFFSPQSIAPSFVFSRKTGDDIAFISPNINAEVVFEKPCRIYILLTADAERFTL